MKKRNRFMRWETLNELFGVPQTPPPEGWDFYEEEERHTGLPPTNKGEPNPGAAQANRERVWTKEMREKSRKSLLGKNKGRKRPDLAERNRRPRPDVAERNRKQNALNPPKRGADGKFIKRDK